MGARKYRGCRRDVYTSRLTAFDKAEKVLIVVSIISDDIVSPLVYLELKVFKVLFLAGGIDMPLWIARNSKTKAVPRSDEGHQFRRIRKTFRVGREIICFWWVATYN